MTTPTKAEIDELIVFWSSQTYPRLEPPSQWATMIDKTIAALQAMKSDGMKATPNDCCRSKDKELKRLHDLLNVTQNATIAAREK